MTNVDDKVVCPSGLNDSWEKFPWDEYPGGVEVSFALAEGRHLLLVEQWKHSFVMPSCRHEKGKLLRSCVDWLLRDLKEKEIPVHIYQDSVKVSATHEVNGTMHLLLTVKSGRISISRKTLLVKDPLVLCGHVGSDPMHRFVAPALGWATTEEVTT